MLTSPGSSAILSSLAHKGHLNKDLNKYMANSNWGWIEAVNPSARGESLFSSKRDKLGSFWLKRHATPGYCAHVVDGKLPKRKARRPNARKSSKPHVSIMTGMVWSKEEERMIPQYR